MPPLPVAALPATSESLREAARLLDAGELVVLPTETVYGVAARADRPDAVRRLRELKVDGREQAFAWHVAEVAQAGALLDAAPGAARRLARRGMPGPLTLLIELDGSAADAVAGGMALGVEDRGAVMQDGTVGLRCPAETAAMGVLASVAAPVVMSAAHRAGERPCRTADDAASRLGDAVEAVIDGGPTRYGKPSTVVRFPRRADGDAPNPAYRIEREGVYDGRMVQQMTRSTVLFVCSGNTCRSAMAEAIGKALLDGAAAETEVLSAGVMAMPGAPASEGAVEALRARGIALSSHRSRPLTKELVNRADTIYTMTGAHREAVLTLAPDASGKTRRLVADRDVTDPIGGDASVYASTADMIEAAVRRRFAEDHTAS